ncbi:hypothetical protein ACFRJ1_07085 [Streptomyces sp. NPDC056773]|uniref:hypothetical protein n=1 Tax=unclassified Streptomyces TaxID=2593676 RepID=UPI0036B71D72
MTDIRKPAPFPRLRWAIRHPLAVLARNGFSPVQTIGILLFTTPVVAWLTYTYFVLLS